jgi:hypothetical protein
MSYLFGDSTPSPWESNFIEVLKDGIDFCVLLLAADQRLEMGRGRALAVERTANAETEKLEELLGAVTLAIEGNPATGTETAAGRCSAAILARASDLVKAELASVRQTMKSELGKVEADATKERQGCVRALEGFLSRQDLPEATSALTLRCHGTAPSLCEMGLKTPYGIECKLGLEIPPASLLAHAVRVERVLERLEVNAPETVGLLHKEVKMRPQRLEKLYITMLSVAPTETTVALRANADGTGGGYDISVMRGERTRVRLTRVPDKDEAFVPPFEVSDADEVRLLTLCDKLIGAAIELKKSRKLVREAKFDGLALEVQERPGAIAERFIAALAPHAQEIARRSQSPSELVLKRLLADDRREEIFVSKTELLRRLEPLPEATRGVFEPLGLSGQITFARASSEHLPPPLPDVAGLGRH